MAGASWNDMNSVMQNMYYGADPYYGSSKAAAKPATNQGYFWKGADGKVYVQGTNGINAAGNWDANTANYWSSRGFVQTPDSKSASRATGTATGTGGGGSGAPAKVLDRAQLTSLDALIARLGTIKEQAITQAKLKRDEAKASKETERKKEKDKYEGGKLSTLQDFSGAKTDTDLNTRNTLENLMSSLSTLGLGGSRALTRQLLDAANMSNRKANATQAKDTMNLDSAFNEYDAGYNDDIKKLEDQYNYDAGEANKKYYQEQQNALYKKADVYGDADMAGERTSTMQQGDSLNSLISGSTFLNPQYKGASRAMATPELGDYTQDIAKYDTTGITGANAPAMTPVTSDGVNAPGNLAVRAIAVNDKDLGIKKKSENDLGYGV